MWRKFEIPASEGAIRDAAEKALPDVLKATGKNKTQISAELFNCPSALGRFLGGKKFSHDRLRALVEGFDAALKNHDDAEGSASCDQAS